MTKHTARRHAGLVAAALIAVAQPPAGVRAQDRNLDSEQSAGKVVRGEIEAGGTPARFLLGLPAGQALEVTAAPVGGSDPYLKVYDAASGDLLGENDDSAGSLAANVRVFSETARRLRIEVSNAAGEDAMRFDLIVRPSDYRPRPTQEIALGQTLSGELDGGGEQLFRFRAERGQLWEFTFAQGPGSELDPALEVFSGERGGGEALASDDDGGGGLNARVRFLAPASGTYVVRGYGVGSTAGAYVMSAGRAQAAARAEVRALELGRAAAGTIDGATRERFYRLSSGARNALAANPGALVIEMHRTGQGEEALDPVLDVGFDTPLGFASLISDDDSGEDSDARVVLDVTELSPVWLEALRIKASGFLDTAGDYALTVATGPE